MPSRVAVLPQRASGRELHTEPTLSREQRPPDVPCPISSSLIYYQIFVIEPLVSCLFGAPPQALINRGGATNL